MKSPSAQRRAAPAKLQRKLAHVLNSGAAAFVVLVLGIALSATAALLTARKVERDANESFERAVAHGRDAVEERIRTYAEVLRGVRGLFIASNTVTREEFQRYIASLDLNRRYPGIQVIHYAHRVSAAERAAFEAAVRNDRSIDAHGYPEFAIKAAQERPEYFAVQYVEPMASNEGALGLELGGDPVRRTTLEHTRDSGHLTATGTIALADDPRRHPGFAMRLPVYAKGLPLGTIDQRREAFVGIVSASFIVIDLMRGVLGNDYLQAMHVRIHDSGRIAGGAAQPPSAQNLMFDSDRLYPAPVRSEWSLLSPVELTAVADLDVGGRRWTMHFQARDAFIPLSERLLPWLAWAAGVIISVLLFGLIRSLATSGRRAVRLAARITQDLRASEARLAEAQRMTEQLIESLPNPIFFKGTDGHYLGVNRAWETFFGVPRAEIVGKTLHALHSNDAELAASRQALDEALWNRPGTQTFETSIVSADGRSRDAIYYKATFTHADGSVAGLIGTIIDITERKKLEQQFEATFDQAAVGIAHFDLEQRNIRVNRRYSEIVGYSPEELLDKGCSGFLSHPDDIGRGDEMREQLLCGAIDHYSQEKRYIRKDGKVIWVTRTESLARDRDGTPLYFIRVIEDITDRKEAAERHRATFDNAPVGIMHTAVEDDRILHANAKLCEMLGYSHEELGRMVTDEFVHPDYVNADQPIYRQKMLRGEIDSFSSERLYRRKDGSDLWVNRTVSLVKDAAGQPLYFIRIVEDISDRKQAENRLAMEHAVARVLAEAETLAEAVPKIVRTVCETLNWHCGARWVHDEDRGVMRCVENWGVDSPEIREFIAINSKRTVAADEKNGQGLVRQALRTRKPVWVADLARVKGFKRAALVAKANLHGAFCFPLTVGNEVLGVMEFFHRDVREPDEMLIQAAQSIGSQIGQYVVRKQAEERVRHLAHFDELTGLPNRSMFNERLQHALNRARRAERSAAVLFIDLDRFKNINDTLGHDAGDFVLKEVARRLRESLRESDTVGRLGGDEFIVLLEEPPRPINAAVVAQKILTALCQPYLVQGQEFDITASIGISTYPDDGADMQTLMKNADIAMYRAKEQGKNNFQFYADHFNVHSIERLTLESSLRRALDRDEFVLHYQPKLDIGSGRITGVEALLRWEQPQGLVPPAQFIQLAEETGLIVPIGEWVLRTACAQGIAWQAQGCPPVRVAVNLSPRQFANERLLEDVTRTLGETGMDPNLLELEITESVVTHHPEAAVVLLKKLKGLGIHLAIDDFGTGYSSLSYLKRFPLDTLKIDRTFIRDLPGDADDAAITQAIIAMAHSLRLSVVAEGVETAEQMSFLRALDCEEIQGYFFSRPQSADAIGALLRAHAPTVALPRPTLLLASNDPQARAVAGATRGSGRPSI